MKAATSETDPIALREFTDGLGVRTVIAERGSDMLELLTLNPALLGTAAFEPALRERVGRLANFRHAYYARVRRVDRLEGGQQLGIVSEHATGSRLSHILDVAERHSLDLDVNAALCLIRQIVPAIALLHNNARDVAHGVLGPERILVTPQARIVITDYVLGSAVQQLGLTRERLWRELRVGVPPGAGTPRIDRRTDVMQIGLVSLALVLGRRLPIDDLRQLPELLATATETTVLGEREPISTPLRRWLSRALQLDPKSPYGTAEEAQRGLEEVLSDEGGYVAAPVALEAFLMAYRDRAASETTLPPAAEPLAPTFESPAPPIPDPIPPAAVVDKPFEGLASRSFEGLAPRSFSEGGPVDSPVVVPAVPETAPVAPAPIDFELPPAEPPQFVLPAPPSRPSVSIDFEASGAPVSLRARLERIALIVCALVALGEGIYIWATRASASEVSTTAGLLAVESRPTGATIVIDGRERGQTPLELRLPAGPHVMELRTEDGGRVVPVTIRAGVTHAQYIEIPSTGAPEQAGGSEPPTTATAAATPVPTAAAAAEAPSPAAPEPPAVGWVRIDVPYEMQVLRDGRVIGNSAQDRLALPPGVHTLEIVNDTLAFRATRTIEVTAGRVRRIAVELPLGSISINALPWADVWINGERVGETPIGNLPIAIGAHEVVFRHPEFGEQRHAVSVTLAGPARLSVNMKP